MDTSDMSDLTARLQACYTGAVFDALRELGHADCVLPRTMRALDVETRVAGPVFTVEGRPDTSISAHESLLAWTDFLTRAPKGHVVVCQPNDDVRALMGELSAETLQVRGVLGYVVDGGCRDNGFIKRIDFPVFARFQSPRDVVAAWRPVSFGEPIVIGSVGIATGDFIVADVDGIVVIPAALAETVVTRVEAVMRTENLVRKAILSGEDPQAAYLKHGKF